MGLFWWEMGIVSDVISCGQEFVETSAEEGPHTGLKGIPGEVTRGPNPMSTSRSPKFGSVGGVNPLVEGGEE